MQAQWHLPLILMAFLVGRNPAFAQGPAWRGEGEWGPRGDYQRLYDPKTVETFKGTVLSVDTFSIRQRGRAGLHLHVLRTKDTLIVHLGPLWFVENQGMSFAPKDTVTVKGSRITYNGGPAIIAAEVTKGGETLVLRNEQGFPAWSAGRRRTSALPGSRLP